MSMIERDAPAPARPRRRPRRALPAASAGAATFVPPRGKVYTGLSGSTSARPFTQQVGSDVAVFGVFTKWYGHNEYAFRAAR